MDLEKHLKKGLKNTILLANGTNFSHGGEWSQVYPNTVLDKWYVGDFSSAEYTVTLELDKSTKEIVKLLVVATENDASVTIYGKSATVRNLVSITAEVNNSYVEIILNPKTVADTGCFAFFAATYFRSHK
tara:strand:- start:15178 stop:15567 length:390 start_codon:yes stop_codon:yes gene_type:complete